MNKIPPPPLWAGLLILIVVGVALLTTKKTRAEMFPQIPLWYDVSPEGEGTRVRYFEYKGSACFVANRGVVVSLQCNVHPLP